MGDPIKPSVMDALLRSQNWTMAAEVGEFAMGPGLLFPKPVPPPRPALIVPVDVQALYVPPGHRETYIKLPMELAGEDPSGNTQAPFSTPQTRSPGVHLHWALPDGLLRGEMQDDEDRPIAMRALPDRWLVVRMSGRKGARTIDKQSWVIEAENGQVFDLEKYPDGPALDTGKGTQISADKLDGLIGGSPSWTASYDASLNRFAFHDTLARLSTSQLRSNVATYVVIGWWSDRGRDPLNGVYSPYSTSRRISDFGWSASPAPSSPAAVADPRFLYATQSSRTRTGMDREVDLKNELKLPASHAELTTSFTEYRYDEVSIARRRPVYDTLMHGLVYGVPVSGRTIARDLAPSASSISLSMAPTLERLVAAQSAQGTSLSSSRSKEYLESLVTAIANTSIMEINSPDGLIKIDEAEHADGFESFQGPETYEDIVVERKQADLSAGRPRRNKAAEAVSGKPPKANVIWTGQRNTQHRPSLDEMRETAGDRVLKDLAAPLGAGAETRRVRRPGPRYHRATSPVIGLSNFGKSDRFHGDGRFSEDGKLLCRWSGELADGFGEFYRGYDFVPPLASEAIPANADRILWNSYLFDPYVLEWALEAIDQTTPAELVDATKNRLSGEIALRFSSDGVYDGIAPVARSKDRSRKPGIANQSLSDELRRFSLIEGRDPSPVTITSWAQPWAPVWLEWEIELEPGSDFEGWVLGRMEFAGKPSSDGSALTLQGRSSITSGLPKTYQTMIDSYLVAENQRDRAEAGELSEDHEEHLLELSEFLERADLGSVTLDQIDELWLALDNGPDGQVRPVPENLASRFRTAGLPRLIASGTLRLTRARIIDSFGRFRDLRTDRITLPTALSARSSSGARALAMPPRLALPSRLMWRFVDASDQAGRREASLNQADISQTINPISGFILPDFIDESLEFFDQQGAPLGEVLHNPVTGGVMWEGGIGRDGPAATSPVDGLDANAGLCGQIAQGMIDADITQRNDPETEGLESPLSAFLRAVDTTMWGVDGDLLASGATVAGLFGRPVAIVSSVLWLDIPTQLSTTGAYGESADEIRDHLIRQGVFDAVKSKAFQVRLGEFAKGHDGLYGFFIGNNWSKLHLIDKEISTAVRSSARGAGYRSLLGSVGGNLGTNLLPPPSPFNCPYIHEGKPLDVHAGQRVRLTLLMHPSARVHASTGLLPRKSLELVRDWVAPGMGRIAPSARIGPVLIDPDKVRLPKIAAFGAEQNWTRRDSPITWRDDPILSATQAALLPDGSVSVEEGYIRIAPGGEADAREDS